MSFDRLRGCHLLNETLRFIKPWTWCGRVRSFAMYFFEFYLSILLIPGAHRFDSRRMRFWSNFFFCMYQNDVSDIPDLTFSMDADEEKLILYEKNEVSEHIISLS